MKKLMIAAAIVCAAVVSQAAQIKWESGELKGVDLTAVNGNGTYDAVGAVLKGDTSSFAYSVAFSLDGVEKGVLSDSSWATSGSKISKSKNLTGLIANTTYDYAASINVVQTSLRTLVSDDWDYSNATLSWMASGDDFRTNPAGATNFTATPGTWTVSGAVAKTTPTPEPTTGLLMLVGLAGLALRRKQA